MLSLYIKNLAKELGKPESEIEKLWQTAKRHREEVRMQSSLQERLGARKRRRC